MTVSYVRSSEVLWRETFDRVIVLVPPDQLVTLSGTGVDLWATFAAPRSLAEAASTLAVRYGVPAGVVERDLASIVADLAARGALQMAGQE